MINANVKFNSSNASIILWNQMGEVDSTRWKENDFRDATEFADAFGILLVDQKDFLCDSSSSYGFTMNDEGCLRYPSKILG